MNTPNAPESADRAVAAATTVPATSVATPSLPANLAASTRMRTPMAEFWRKFKRQKLALFAGVFIIALVLVAILAPWIVPYDAENFLTTTR